MKTRADAEGVLFSRFLVKQPLPAGDDDGLAAEVWPERGQLFTRPGSLRKDPNGRSAPRGTRTLNLRIKSPIPGLRALPSACRYTL
jgi:hypothetical protein